MRNAAKDKSASNERERVDGERGPLKEYLYRLVRLGVNLRQDWFFHIMFGRTEATPFLCGLMNAVLQNVGEPPVKSIKIKNPFTFAQRYGDKDVVLDFAVEDELGNKYDVEMQTWEHKNFRERVVYYLEKLAAEQLKKGESYIQLHRVVGIVFVDFPIWSEQELQKIKNLTPDLTKKLKETQFETIKLMSVDNGVAFSDCLSLYFVRIPEAGEAFSPSLRNPQLIDWLKVFRFPESTSEEEILQIESSTPEIKELIDQMLEILATPKQRAYIESRRRSTLYRNTILEDYAAVKKDYAAVKKDYVAVKKDYVALSEYVERLEQERREQEVKRRDRLTRAVAQRYNRPISEVETALEGQTQRTFDAAFESLATCVDFDAFVKAISEAH